MAKKETTTALLPPIVVMGIEPPVAGDVDGAHGGIGLRHTERDLVVYLENPKDGVTPGAFAYLYWGNRNVPVASTPIREGDENLTLIPLTVPVHRIVEYWANPVFGKIRRTSGNETLTEEIKLRVRLNRPGEYDPDYQMPGHQGLVYVVPPHILLNGVSEEAALAGIKIIIRRWLFMGAYDLIILAWGSQQVLHRVQPGEVGQDITLTVDYATISAAGNNPLTRVAYQVRDAGGNLPDERSRWSAVSLIDVHMNEIRPEAPWLAFPDTGTQIDLADLGSWDAEVEIWVTGAQVAAYSHVTLIWAGTDSDGNSVPHTVTKVLSGTGIYSFTVDNALVVAIAEGTASVHALFQKGSVEQPSEKLYLDITGEVLRWPAPTIDEDLGGHIEPDKNATVRFPLQGSWPANGYLEVIFRVSSPDNTIEHRVGREVDDIPATPEGDMLFTVYPDELARFDGHLVEVFYAHTRPGSRPQESLRLQIVVGELARTLPAPIVDKTISGQLNPDDVGAYVKVFAPFTGTKRGDWIRMFWIGAGARTEVAVEVAVDGSTTEHDIDQYYVINNLNRSVTVFYTLKRDEEPPLYSLITDVLISREVGDLPAPSLLGSRTTPEPDTAELHPLDVQHGTKAVVSYIGMRNSDSIKLTMAGAGNGGSPDIPAKSGNEALQKVEFDITQAAIHANIRDRDTTVTFTYVVTRAGTPKTSDTLTVIVKPIPQAELAKTVLQINQANATTMVLELSSFTGNATARIGTWAFMTVRYPVWLDLYGKTDNNVDHPLRVYDGATNASVNATWISTGKIEPALPRTYLDGLGPNTKLRMVFKAATSLSKVEEEAITFRVVEYTVNNLPAQFPVPKLTQATGTGTSVTLAPLNAQAGATVSVEYSPMLTTDSIKVTMVGTAGLGSPTIAAKNGVVAGKVEFSIPASAIAANIGNANKTFTLKYEVTRASVVRASQILTVTVTPIPQAELAKTVIKLNQANATTKVLELRSFAGNAMAHISTWPFMTASYAVWLKFVGKTAGGADHVHVVFSGASGAIVNPGWISAGHYEWGLLRSYLDGLGHNTTLRMEFKAAFSLSKVEEEAISFPVTEYLVHVSPAVSKEDFEALSPAYYMYPRTLSTANMLIRTTTWLPDTTHQLYFQILQSQNTGQISGKVLRWNPYLGGWLHFDLNYACSKVSFWMTGFRDSQTDFVTVYDQGMNVLYHGPIQGDPAGKPVFCVYTGANIKYIRLQSWNFQAVFDNFEFTKS